MWSKLYIFERSLETSQLPKDWTQTRVTILFKKGNKCYPAANYKPISFICYFRCKVMEHIVDIVASNVAQHLDENDTLYELQHGFREKGTSFAKHSCLNLSRNWAEKYQTVTRSIWSCQILARPSTR